MCKFCGCGPSGGNTQIKLIVNGFGNAKEVEKSLLGLPGVYHVHVHAHDGQTTVDYNPARISPSDITAKLAERGLQAVV
ncbi:heavy-metal-associated domain-containing protein [Acetonema longum]|uniref:HMA domain-containing protein n=1 Tax=Acetonema longum DSM 6540 TaxID=1009370 RepID=F7NIS3_9FIRM|nr:heavy metal-associated domain-containing protein [Acetonema longum]EGO64046.1 hypothetical protein ALO_09879 [Acetonema longum DSM 6540]